MTKKNDNAAVLDKRLGSGCVNAGMKSHKYPVPRLNNEFVEFPDAEPDTSTMPITHLDMDPTEVCNLRCSYCFKGKLTDRKMSLETAKQSVKFLVKHSGDIREVGIALLGGEPLLAFDLLKRWVPWTHRYCEQRDKKLRINVTTNGTVFNQEHHDFFREWHIGLHLSLDGTPEVQDKERVFSDGRGSSNAVEANLPRIFSAWRTIHARSTIVPETVSRLFESYKYFCDKGFYKVAFAITHDDKWAEPKFLSTLESELRKVLHYHWQHVKKHNKHFVLTLLESYIKKDRKPIQGRCGAGRGSVHVDTDGLLWPCHRFCGEPAHRNLILGNVQGGFHNALRQAFLNINPSRDYYETCNSCETHDICLPGCIAANWQEQSDIHNPGKGFCQATQLIYRLCKEHAEELETKEPQQWKKFTEWALNNKAISC